MEKFFIVKNKSLIKQVKDFESMRKKVDDAFKEFAKINHIETTEYYQLTNQLKIVPTVNDGIRFDNQLKVDNETFKKNSEMNKKWVSLCEERGLTTPHKPNWELSALIGRFTKFKSRLFSIDEIVYGSFDAYYDFELPEEYFTELKASEFYKIIEDWEEGVK